MKHRNIKMQLTKEQRVFVVENYHQSQRSLATVKQRFQARFPNRNPPTSRTILLNVRKYSNHGTSINLNKGNSGRRVTVRDQATINQVRQSLEANHGQNITCRRNGLNLSPTTFHKIVSKDLKWHPYKIHISQGLKPDDYNRRYNFCAWFINQCRNPRFLANFVIGDEASFAMNGTVSTQNVRCYAPKGEAPNFRFEKNDCREKITVWGGLCGNGVLLGPYFPNGNLNGAGYLRMLNNDILPELERHFANQLINGNFQRLWWAQDGAPAHRLIAVRNLILQKFERRVVALNTPREWPPRSPDLTPCDFFLWGYLKQKVFRTPPVSLVDLRTRIVNEFNQLRTKPNFLRKAVREMRRRAADCIDQNGGHVEGNLG